MKKFLCVLLSCLMLLFMAACKRDGETTPPPTENPGQVTRPSLEACGPWVVSTEFELASGKNREYRYDAQGKLLGYDQYQATYKANELGGETMQLIPYDQNGNLITHLSVHTYVYNEAGQLAKYQRNEGTGKLADSFLFSYNSDGKVIKQEKFYMDNFHELIEFVYEGEKLTKSTFRSSVHEAEYTYVYDSEGVPSQINYLIKYVKSGNEIKGNLALQKSVYETDTLRRVTLSSSSQSSGVAQGKEVLIFEEHYDAQGQVQKVELQLLNWELFQVAWMPMRQLGAMNTTHWSGGTAKFVYEPLSVYLANQK